MKAAKIFALPLRLGWGLRLHSSSGLIRRGLPRKLGGRHRVPIINV